MAATWIALFAALWVVVLLLVVLMLGLIRKVATLEARLALGEHEPSYVGGPGLGAPAPSVAGRRELTGAPDSEHGRVVLFLSSSCGACRRLAGELRPEDRQTAPSTWAAREFELVVVTDPNGRQIYADLDVDAMVVQTGGELSRAWSVPATPFAVAVDSKGVVRGSAFASTRGKLDELIRALKGGVVDQRVLSGAMEVGGAEKFI